MYITESNFVLRDKLSPGTKPGFLKSEKYLNLKIAIKQVLYIRVNNPSLNRNVAKYHLPHIWDEVLPNIPELKLK